MSNIIEAIKAINPKAQVSVNAEDYDQITWYADTPVISKSDIQAKQAELKADFDSKQYQRDRQPEYPPATDYLDGIVKGDQAQIDKYIADCLAIKDKYPKE